MTVFYDRNKPSDNVLEREISTRSFEIALLIGALIAVVGVFGMLITEDVGAVLAQFVPQNGRTSGAMFVAVMGVIALVFGYAVYQQGAATFKWPKVQGRIARSDADAVRAYYLRPGGVRRYGYLFRSQTVYDYQVNGVRYESDRTSYGAQAYASFTLLARRSAGQFAAGESAEVFYNPVSPEQAVLVRGASGQWVIWVGGTGLFAVAATLIGLI